MTLINMASANWEHALAELNSRAGWDCTVSAFDGWRLQVSGGTSEETQQPLATFCGVSYLSCPMVFSHPKFRVAGADEVAGIQRLVPLDADDKVIAIEAETMSGLAPIVFFVVAQAVEVAPSRP